MTQLILYFSPTKITADSKLSLPTREYRMYSLAVEHIGSSLLIIALPIATILLTRLRVKVNRTF